MKKQLLISIFAVSSICFVGGCHSDSSSSSSTATTEPVADAPPSKPIPPDSIFAKVKMGMSEGEVQATIGTPTTVDTYQTGKAFIPFHFSGSDDVRRTAHYKGVGTITFSLNSAYGSSYSVVSIDYDPSEPGFAK
jgi:hypothetical protein